MMPVMRNRNWLPSLFNDFFGDEWLDTRFNRTATPAINILEEENGFRVEVAAPGMTKEDFRVELNQENEMVICLEKKSAKESDGGKVRKQGAYLRREFAYSTFRQSFLLPDNVDRSRIEARMEHGVLTIELPKMQHNAELPATRIEIK